MSVLGVDLAANTRNPTAVAVLDGRDLVALGTARTDDELVAVAREHGVTVVAVDAPLSPPDGRAGSYASRIADQRVRAAGYGAMPPALLGALTFRGMVLSRRFRDAGFTVIEVFPRATLMMLGHEIAKGGRKTEPAEVAAARATLAGHVAGLPRVLPDDHAADAVAAALTGVLHLESRTVAHGDPEEGVIQLPDPAKLLP